MSVEKGVWTNANGVWHGRYGLKLGGAVPGHWRAERMEWGRFGTRHQESYPLYPESAVREALINALGHRDYSSPSGGVSIHSFPRRLEIWNSGSLPDGVTAESLAKGHISVLRNPDIAHVLYLRGLMEKAGRGSVLMIHLTDDHIERVVKAYEQFKDEPDFTRVATLEEIRAKDGNLSIPLYVASATNRESNTRATAPGGPDLSTALGCWLESSAQVRSSLRELMAKAPK